MYVSATTTQEQIKDRIAQIIEELNGGKKLREIERVVLREELDYLYSFITLERW